MESILAIVAGVLAALIWSALFIRRRVRSLSRKHASSSTAPRTFAYLSGGLAFLPAVYFGLLFATPIAGWFMELSVRSLGSGVPGMLFGLGFGLALIATVLCVLVAHAGYFLGYAFSRARA